MPEVILEMIGIDKCFPGVKALSNVDFDLKIGEIHGLIGENGAGKSTLMNVLMGIYKADNGKVIINGRAETVSSPIQAMKLGIGMVPQELNLNPFVSAAENIFLGNLPKTKFGAINWNKTNNEAKKILLSIGVDIATRTVVNKLSTAQQQLVQIARALTTGANILIFDEPTASLTVNETKFLFKIMKQLKRQKKSVVFITHHLEELMDTTDRITVMRDGSVVKINKTHDITIDQLIEQMAGKKVTKREQIERNISNEVMLKVEGFTIKHEFEDVSFEVKRGEIFGIGGLVGSGRTELANAIFGITSKEEGKIFFEGNEVDIKSPPQAIKLGIGYVPEERRSHGIFPMLSVSENTVITIYNLLFKKMKIQYKKAKLVTEDYIRKLKIKTPNVNTPIRSLSGGNQQKVVLSRWLVKDAKLLILDEPTRGIDVNAKGEIYILVRELANQGMTIIFISSEHEELLTLTDRIMIMHEGKVKAIMNTAELSQQGILEVALKKGAE